MIGLRLDPSEAMQTLFDNGFYLVQHDAARRLVVMQRSRHPLSPVDLVSVLAKLLAVMRGVRGQRLLIDVRLGPGNNNPALELPIQQFRRQIAELFPTSATLVATAVGRLQIMRMSRERNDGGIHVFLDEAEAIAHLLNQEL